MKTLTLTIVIPVYNEELHLASCLDAIAGQTELPDQVVVVDNNSSDASRDIARRYPFVTLVCEPEQGLIAARNRGFVEATGDIVGRINADVRLDTNWVARAKQQFVNQPALSALAGIGRNELIINDISYYTRVFSWFYIIAAEAYFRTPVLWGANMVVRRSAWQAILPDLCRDDAIVHEDQDISLCLARNGHLVKRDNQLIMQTVERSYFYYPKLKEYIQRRWATKRYHIDYGSYHRPEFRRYNGLQVLWRTAFATGPYTFYVLCSPVAYIATTARERLRALSIG